MPTGHSPRAGAANAPSPVREFQGLSAPLASGRGTVMGPHRRSRGPTASPVVALDPAMSSREPSPVKLARFPVCTDPLSPAEVLADGTPAILRESPPPPHCSGRTAGIACLLLTFHTQPSGPSCPGGFLRVSEINVLSPRRDCVAASRPIATGLSLLWIYPLHGRQSHFLKNT